MLSEAFGESGSKVYPSRQQYCQLQALLDCDNSPVGFDTELKYAFTSIDDGDVSNIKEVDLTDGSWYAPTAIVNVDCQVVVSDWVVTEQPEWYAMMVKYRGEPKKPAWGMTSDQLTFNSPADFEDEESCDELDFEPDIYELSAKKKKDVQIRADQIAKERLNSERIEVTDEDHIWRRDEDDNLYVTLPDKEEHEVFYRSEDESEADMYFAGYRQISATEESGDWLYIKA
jgi:hypothetical protein